MKHITVQNGMTCCGKRAHTFNMFSGFRIGKDINCLDCLGRIIMEYNPVSGIYKEAEKQIQFLQYKTDFEELLK